MIRLVAAGISIMGNILVPLKTIIRKMQYLLSVSQCVSTMLSG